MFHPISEQGDHSTERGVAGAAVCAVDVVQCVVMFSAGKMTLEELETRTGKNLFQTGAGVAGASLGAAVGALGGPAGALVGSLIGELITTLAMNIALDNHIEKEFQLTLASTEQVVGSAMGMHEALEYFMGHGLDLTFLAQKPALAKPPPTNQT